jgi:hypothetical protein
MVTWPSPAMATPEASLTAKMVVPLMFCNAGLLLSFQSALMARCPFSVLPLAKMKIWVHMQEIDSLSCRLSGRHPASLIRTETFGLAPLAAPFSEGSCPQD